MANQISWTAFKLAMRQQIWPYPNEAKNLVTVHDGYFQEAIVDIQSWVPQLQVNNTSVHPFCSTLWECNKSVVAAPKGEIRRIFTILNDDWCNKVFYDSTNFTSLEALARSITDTTPPAGNMIQQGLKYAEASSDNTCGTKRARRGVWAIYRKKLWIAPWIQSGESIVVEWDGVKDTYEEVDQLDADLWGTSERLAIKLYVQAKHETFFGDKNFGMKLEKDYDAALADLIHSYWHQTKQQEIQSSLMDREPTADELTADQAG